jgi:23S rRNA (guanine745-N1)-methyltransferase
MGPHARHLDRGTVRDRVAALPEPVAVTLAVDVSVHARTG